MTTSSASIVPDSEPLRIAEAMQEVASREQSGSPARAAVHVAPKRTYGRAKPAASVLLDAPRAPSPPHETHILSSTRYASPDFSPPAYYPRNAGTSDWRRELKQLDARDVEDEEVDDDEIARFLAEQRGKALEPMKDVQVDTEEVLTAGTYSKLKTTYPSSSLPPLTSSSLPPLTSSQLVRPTSPIGDQNSRTTSPQAATQPSSSHEDETATIQRPGASRTASNGKKRALFLSQSEVEDEIASPIPRPFFENPTSPETPQPTHSRRKRNRLSSVEVEDDDTIQDITLPEPESPIPPHRSPLSPRVTSSEHKTPKDRRSALQKLARSKAMQTVEDEVVGGPSRAVNAVEAEINDFVVEDDDADFDVRTSGKGKRAKEVTIRGLSKKAQLEMERVQAQIRQSKRDRLDIVYTVTPTMADTMKEVMKKVSQAQSSNKPLKALSDIRPPTHPPPLIDDKNPASSSSMEPMPQDDIAPFSSATCRTADEEEHREALTQSSPSAARGGNGYSLVLKPATATKVSNHSFDEDLPSLHESLAQANAKEKVEALKKRKEDEVARRRSKGLFKGLAQYVADDNDDVEILDRPPAKVVRKLGGSASAVLTHTPIIRSDAARQIMVFNGPGVIKQEVATESMLKNAGNRFGHADSRVKDGPFRPAGIKDNKLVTITMEQLANDLIARSRLQAAKEVKRKEEESGMKAKALPAKVNLDEDALLAASNTVIETGDENQAMDSEDDAEDSDFHPADDAASMNEAAENGAEDVEEIELAYSGDSEARDDEEMAEVSDNETHLPANGAMSQDMENFDPVAEDDDAVVRKAGSRRARTKALIADSDDEMDGVAETLPNPSETETAAKTSAPGDDLELDLDGGFSQFFEPTQAATLMGATQTGGFSRLRHDAAPEIRPLKVVLPDVGVSATALQRDEALLQAEMAMAAQRDLVLDDREALQYLNEDGFFTQTKPKTHIYDSFSGFVDESQAALDRTSDEPNLSATYRTRVASDNRELSLSPVGPRLKRLRPRSPSVEEIPQEDEFQPTPTQVETQDSMLEETFPALPPKQLVPNAFDTLMASKGQAPPAARTINVTAREFVEDQADESEEEDAFGFHRSDDEAEDGEDQDGIVEGLVDDQEMTEAEKEAHRLAVEKKHREIMGVEDKRNEELHRDAIAGKLRGKRRDGVLGIEFSDDEDEDDGRRRRRLAKRRARQVDGGVDELNDMDEDAPFRRQYEKDLQDSDDEDAAEADADSFPGQPQRPPSPVIRTEVISAAQVQRKMREVAKENRNREDEAERQREAGPRRRPDMVVLGSDSESEGENAGFKVTKNARTASSTSKATANKDKRFKQLLDESQNPGDSRRAGGNSSVSQLKQGSGKNTASTGSTFKGMQKTAVAKPLPKKRSSMSRAVMSKTSGFDA